MIICSPQSAKVIRTFRYKAGVKLLPRYSPLGTGPSLVKTSPNAGKQALNITAGGPGSGRHPEYGQMKESLEQHGYKLHPSGNFIKEHFIHPETRNTIEVHPQEGTWKRKDYWQDESGKGSASLHNYLTGLHRVAAGGPGSGRHPGSSPPKDSNVIRWVNHPQHGIMFAPTGTQNHQHWFKQIGLPDFGPKFDMIERGIAEINHKNKSIDTVNYSTKRTPQEVVRHIQEHRPETRSYVHDDAGHESLAAARTKCPKCGSSKYSLMPTDFETAKCQKCGKLWDINAGGPGSGCHGPNCGRPSGVTKGVTTVHGTVIPKSEYPLTKAQRVVETRFRRQIAADPQKFLKEYVAKFNNELNADNAKELSPDYRRTNASRTAYAAAVHEPASWIVKTLFAGDKETGYQLHPGMLNQEPPEGKKNIVFFTAGGAGAGKTASVKSDPRMEKVIKEAHIVYDGTLRPADSAIKKIDMALNAGKNVVVAFTDRPPIQAFSDPNGSVLERANRTGRTVMIEEFANQYSSIRHSMAQVQEKYKDNPRFAMGILDNSHGKNNARLVNSLDELPPPTHTDREELVKDLKQELNRAYKENRIDKRIYEATYGHAVPKEIGI